MARIVETTAEELLGPLNDIEKKNAPPVLYVAGRTELIFEGPRVALIGSRDATDQGRESAAALASEFARTNVTIVSGLARGIDTVAQQNAIDAGGRTIAVLGTPLDICTPKQNEFLQQKIMLEHLAVSQFACGVPVQRGNFPMRNRTMALICHASIIVEAGDGSGTLSQGWEALRLGRPLFIMERVANNTNLSWPEKMLGYGAQLLGSELDDVLDLLPDPKRISDLEYAF